MTTLCTLPPARYVECARSLALGIAGAAQGRELVDLGADDEGAHSFDVDGVVAVAIFVGVDVHVGGELLEGLIAFILKVIGWRTRELGLVDAHVEVADFVRGLVDFLGVAVEPGVDVPTQVDDFAAKPPKVVRHGLGRFAHALPNGFVFGLVPELPEFVIEASDQAIEPVAVHFVENIFGLLEHHVFFFEVGHVARAVADLLFYIFIIDPLDAAYGRARAHVAFGEGPLRVGGLRLHALPGVALGVGIGDVVARRRDHRFRRHHPRDSGALDVRKTHLCDYASLEMIRAPAPFCDRVPCWV